MEDKMEDKMILNPVSTNTRQFTWNPQSREYVGEISSTNGFGRVYDDAIDEGLTLISAKTGNLVVFVIDQIHRDREGDVLYWVLKPAGRSAIADVRVRLFND